MSYKDTLKLYDELRGAGVAEPSARAQAEQLGSMGTVLDAMTTTIDKRLDRMDKKLDLISKDMFWMRAIGAAMIVTFLSNAFVGFCK